MSHSRTEALCTKRTKPEGKGQDGSGQNRSLVTRIVLFHHFQESICSKRFFFAESVDDSGESSSFESSYLTTQSFQRDRPSLPSP